MSVIEKVPNLRNDKANTICRKKALEKCSHEVINHQNDSAGNAMMEMLRTAWIFATTFSLLAYSNAEGLN